jgi:N-acetylglucosamine-6-sulfatase
MRTGHFIPSRVVTPFLAHPMSFSRLSIFRPLTGLCLALLATFSASAASPNILWIMSDDHAAQAVGAYGGRLAPLNPTPTIDRLAREGIRFENVFCSNSICTPSRATLLSGQYSHVNGVRTLADPITPDRIVLPRVMSELGYTTAMIGKWHLHAEPVGFDYYCVLPGQGTYFNPVFHDQNLGAWPDNQRQMIGRIVGQADAALHADDAITDLSLQWLKRRDPSKPFFLMHHFKSPHGNWENPESTDFLYEGIDIPEPANLRTGPITGSPGTDGLGSSIGQRNLKRNIGMQMRVDPALAPDNYRHEAYQRYLKKYLRCVRGVDDNIARLLAHLESTGELDNTLILYTSDQGQLTGEHDYYDKRWMYEESLRMPFIVRYPPAIKAGLTSDAMITNVDFAPTLIDLAGGVAPASMQGRSFKPMIEGRPAPADWRDAVYYRYWMQLAHHHVPAHYGIRTTDYKLIFFYGLPLDATGAVPQKSTPGWQLFDLRHDPEENHDVYLDPKYADTVVALKKQLIQLKQEVGDTDDAYPELTALRDQS